MSRELAKQTLGDEGRFVILTDLCGRPHKQVARMLEIFPLEIFRRFAEGKDDVLLHLQCDPEDLQDGSPGSCSGLRSEMAALHLSSKIRLTPDMPLSTVLDLPQPATIYQAAVEALHIQIFSSEISRGMSLPP